MTDKKEEKSGKKIVIEGVTESGEVFRPTNWAERVSGKLSTFKKHHIQYSPLLRPSRRNGNCCVILDPKLKESNPALYDSIMKFATSNHLKICDEEGHNSPHEP
ncbi:MAG TPA: DUF3579 domain-containing protein [Coxiellaceae bacterium]|nr:DUF3579 domain-containing protein [Coxiellaceae bacterium]